MTTEVHHPLREAVLEVLRGGNAHTTFEKAVEGLPVELRGSKPKSQPHTPWRLLEHMRLAQWDILEFVRNEHHQSPPWPAGYWPKQDSPPSADAWEKSVASFLADRRALEEMIASPYADLLQPISHGEGQTLLREVILAADHAAYHIGQMVMLRRLLGAWHEG